MIAEKENSRIEKYKVLFQYVTVCLTALLGGILFANALGVGSLLNFGEQIKIHFFSPMPEDELFYNCIVSVMYYSMTDILCIVAAFLFTFSIFNYLASDVILIYEGFSIGFSCMTLYKCCSLFNSVPTVYFIYYALFKVIFVAFIIAFLYGLTVYSFGLKSYTSNYRVNLNFRLLIFLALFTISGCGFIFLLNSLYYAVIVIF